MDKLSENNNFKVPEGYFESLSDKIMVSIAQEETSYAQGKGFKVPEDYFVSLNSKILQKLEEGETKVISLKSYKKYYYMAASVAAVIALFIVIQLNSVKMVSYSNLANADIEQYFEYNELGISSYDLAEIISLNDIDFNDILENRLDNDHIIDYLNSNIEDFEELNLQNDD